MDLIIIPETDFPQTVNSGQARKHLSRTYRAPVSAWSNRHPSLTRGLALLFFLAGLILCMRML